MGPLAVGHLTRCSSCSNAARDIPRQRASSRRRPGTGFAGAPPLRLPVREKDAGPGESGVASCARSTGGVANLIDLGSYTKEM